MQCYKERAAEFKATYHAEMQIWGPKQQYYEWEVFKITQSHTNTIRWPIEHDLDELGWLGYRDVISQTFINRNINAVKAKL